MSPQPTGLANRSKTCCQSYHSLSRASWKSGEFQDYKQPRTSVRDDSSKHCFHAHSIFKAKLTLPRHRFSGLLFAKVAWGRGSGDLSGRDSLSGWQSVVQGKKGGAIGFVQEILKSGMKPSNKRNKNKKVHEFSQKLRKGGRNREQ